MHCRRNARCLDESAGSQKSTQAVVCAESTAWGQSSDVAEYEDNEGSPLKSHTCEPWQAPVALTPAAPAVRRRWRGRARRHARSWRCPCLSPSRWRLATPRESRHSCWPCCGSPRRPFPSRPPSRSPAAAFLTHLIWIPQSHPSLATGLLKQGPRWHPSLISNAAPSRTAHSAGFSCCLRNSSALIMSCQLEDTTP